MKFVLNSKNANEVSGRLFKFLFPDINNLEKRKFINWNNVNCGFKKRIKYKGKVLQFSKVSPLQIYSTYPNLLEKIQITFYSDRYDNDIITLYPGDEINFLGNRINLKRKLYNPLSETYYWVYNTIQIDDGKSFLNNRI